MADCLHRASLLFQLFLHGLWMNTIQRANNWIRAHPVKKNKVENLKGSYFSKGDTFFEFSNLEIGTKNYEIFGGNPRSEDVQTFSNPTESVAKDFAKTKKRMMSRKNKVDFEVSGRHVWDADIKGKNKKQRRSRTLRLFGSRSTKSSNVKNDFAKPFCKSDSKKFPSFPLVVSKESHQN